MPSKARLSRQREAEIAGLAEHIAMTRFHGERVQPEEIALQEGIAFRYASFPEEFDGIILHEKGKFFIVCNERRAQRGTPRSRFTIAHELGHYFLDNHRLALASGKCPAHFSLAEFISDQPIERESDVFAANLLMPGEAFRTKAAALPEGLERVRILSSVYGTSLLSTAIRAIELESFPEPAALLRWDQPGNRGPRWIAAKTYERGSEFREMVEAPPAGSVTAQAIANLDSGLKQGAAIGEEWFTGLAGGRQRGMPLREEVISLGFYGWMTLIYSTEGGVKTASPGRISATQALKSDLPI